MKTTAKGFISKDTVYLNAEVIKTVAEGKTYVQPDLALDIIQSQAHVTNVLTDREYQVLTLITQGYTHESIVEKLRISRKTVFNVKYRGFKKLKIETPQQLQDIL